MRVNKLEIITMLLLVIGGFMAGRVTEYPVPYVNFTASKNDITLLFWGLAVVSATLTLEAILTPLTKLNKFIDKEGQKLESKKIVNLARK